MVVTAKFNVIYLVVVFWNTSHESIIHDGRLKARVMELLSHCALAVAVAMAPPGE